MPEPRKHHFLPKFYLKNFSRDGKLLYRISKKNNKHVYGTINNFAAIRDLYRLDNDIFEDKYIFEKKAIEIRMSHEQRYK